MSTRIQVFMNNPATITERSLTFVRHFPGRIERVWAYLTDPKFLATWLSDGDVADFVGGEVRLNIGATGRVTVFQPPYVLEYTWSEPEHQDRESPRVVRCSVADSVVRWELAEVGNGVLLMLTHSQLPDNEVLPHGAGWHALLDRLSDSVHGRAPRPFGELYAQCMVHYDDVIAGRVRKRNEKLASGDERFTFIGRR